MGVLHVPISIRGAWNHRYNTRDNHIAGRLVLTNRAEELCCSASLLPRSTIATVKKQYWILTKLHNI
jgi:hypothetical protein